MRFNQVLTVDVMAGVLVVSLMVASPDSSMAGQANYYHEQGIASFNEGRFQRAAELFERAAELANVATQAKLGYLYYTGCGVPLNDSEALRWSRKAADQGHDKA